MELVLFLGGFAGAVLIGYGAGLINGAKKDNRNKGEYFIYVGIAVCVGIGVYRNIYGYVI